MLFEAAVREHTDWLCDLLFADGGGPMPVVHLSIDLPEPADGAAAHESYYDRR